MRAVLSPRPLSSHHPQGYQTIIMSPFAPLLIFLFFFSSFTVAWDYPPPPPPPDCTTTQSSYGYFSSLTGPSSVYPPASSSTGPPVYPPASSSTGPSVYPPQSSSTGPSTTHPPTYPSSSHVSVITSTPSSRSYTYGNSNSTTSIHGGSGGYVIHHKSHGGTIAGSIIGGIVGICIIVVALFFYCQRRRRRSPVYGAGAATGYGQVGGYNQQVTETPSQPVTYVRSHTPPPTSNYSCVLMRFSTHRARKTHLRPPGTKHLQTRLTLLRHLPYRTPEIYTLPPRRVPKRRADYFLILPLKLSQ